MILTGKALEDFLKFHQQDKVWYDLMIKSESYTILYALIIEWLDSVGIYVSLKTDIVGDVFEFDVFVNELYFGSNTSRQEATRQAIIKANDIYNDR